MSGVGRGDAIMEQNMEQYCRRVRASLQCSSEDAKRCITDVRRTAERLRQEEPEISQEEIEKFLGEPKEVARMFQDMLGPKRVERYRRRKKLCFGFLIGFFLVALLATLYLIYYIRNNLQTTYTESLYITSYELPSDDPESIPPRMR